ncbi:hypothetical protein QTP86_016100 [Hemibagrus guttatus]|nr:hypothetical protein QTP86_016100 [Hemibagrus guttatus]
MLEPLLVPQRPWTHISTNFLTNLPSSGGFTTVMVVIDCFSKACKLVPMKVLPIALPTADALFQHVFRNFGLPEAIVPDQGAYCSREQRRWSEFLPWAEYAQNSLTHSSMGLTPFQCVLGYQPHLFPWSEEPSDVAAVADWFRSSQEVWEWAHVRLQRAIRQQGIQANRPHPPYTLGQSMWLLTMA